MSPQLQLFCVFSVVTYSLPIQNKCSIVHVEREREGGGGECYVIKLSAHKMK